MKNLCGNKQPGAIRDPGGRQEKGGDRHKAREATRWCTAQRGAMDSARNPRTKREHRISQGTFPKNGK